MKEPYSNIGSKAKKAPPKDRQFSFDEKIKNCRQAIRGDKTSFSKRTHYDLNSARQNTPSNKNAKFPASFSFRILAPILAVISILALILLALVVFDQLWKLNKEFFSILFGAFALIGMNIVAYLASFRWHKRKPWFFLASVFLTIVVISIFISIFL